MAILCARCPSKLSPLAEMDSKSDREHEEWFLAALVCGGIHSCTALRTRSFFSQDDGSVRVEPKDTGDAKS